MLDVEVEIINYRCDMWSLRAYSMGHAWAWGSGLSMSVGGSPLDWGSVAEAVGVRR